MKFEEAKIGMRVGLCRTAYRHKHIFDHFDTANIDYEYFPGLITKIVSNARRVFVQSLKSGVNGWFACSVLVIDE